MTDNQNPAGKVAGYTAQPDAKVALVNEFKTDEERLLRKLDALDRDYARNIGEHGVERIADMDLHSLYMAKDHFRIAFMLLNRAVFQPQRISLPEDE